MEKVGMNQGRIVFKAWLSRLCAFPLRAQWLTSIARYVWEFCKHAFRFDKIDKRTES